jgi:uracil-DNA glycosylase
MPVTYLELLDLAIQQVQESKAAGTRFVAVSQDLLRSLNAPLNRVTRSAASNRSEPPRPLAPASFAAKPPAISAIDPPAAEPILSTRAGMLSSAAKSAAMAELRDRALACQKCPHLVRTRTNVVFGVGSIDAELMFVGEAPGAEEDAEGEPFVGNAGQLLTRIIHTMGLSRETVYIANILKCRPDMPPDAPGNRKPEPEEMKTCLPYLLAQIDLIRPKVMVALGGTAVQGLLGSPVGITKLRGRFQDFRGIPVMPTYHPSYLLRNESLSVKRELWEDMLLVLERLAMPISAKQRGYFLKASS